VATKWLPLGPANGLTRHAVLQIATEGLASHCMPKAAVARPLVALYRFATRVPHTVFPRRKHLLHSHTALRIHWKWFDAGSGGYSSSSRFDEETRPRSSSHMSSAITAGEGTAAVATTAVAPAHSRPRTAGAVRRSRKRAPATYTCTRGSTRVKD
jgi:hypothetical protein